MLNTKRYQPALPPEISMTLRQWISRNTAAPVARQWSQQLDSMEADSHFICWGIKFFFARNRIWGLPRLETTRVCCPLRHWTLQLSRTDVLYLVNASQAVPVREFIFHLGQRLSKFIPIVHLLSLRQRNRDEFPNWAYEFCWEWAKRSIIGYEYQC